MSTQPRAIHQTRDWIAVKELKSENIVASISMRYTCLAQNRTTHRIRDFGGARYFRLIGKHTTREREGDGSSGASVQTSNTVGRPHTYWMCPVPEISIQLLIQNDIIWFLNNCSN